MKTTELIAGMAILSGYTEDKYPVCAEHGIIYFNADRTVSEEDIKVLLALGWSYGDYEEVSDEDGELDIAKILTHQKEEECYQWLAYV